MPGEGMEELKAHPDYKAGYEAALRGEPMDFVSAAFDAGWQAATDAKNILGIAGFTETSPGQFTQTSITGAMSDRLRAKAKQK